MAVKGARPFARREAGLTLDGHRSGGYAALAAPAKLIVPLALCFQQVPPAATQVTPAATTNTPIFLLATLFQQVPATGTFGNLAAPDPG